MEGRTTIRRQGKNKGKAVIGESMFAQESTRIGEKGTRRKGELDIISPTWISNPCHLDARTYLEPHRSRIQDQTVSD
jgi:hypothetical protein